MEPSAATFFGERYNFKIILEIFFRVFGVFFFSCLVFSAT